jgi:hypothetical protein
MSYTPAKKKDQKTDADVKKNKPGNGQNTTDRLSGLFLLMQFLTSRPTAGRSHWQLPQFRTWKARQLLVAMQI